MIQPRQGSHSAQRGVVLLSSLLLLLVVTIMALSMFRSFGMQERISGNMREKQRALQAANSAQQYAEWWLANQSGATFAVSQGSAAYADAVCNTTTINANTGTPLICNNTLQQLTGITNAALWPTTAAASTAGASYIPPGMNTTSPALANYYATKPQFYIADLGALATARGEAYQIDAFGYGLSTTAIAVVESTVAVTCVVCNVGGL